MIKLRTLCLSKALCLVFFTLAGAAAQVIPGRYIVELTAAPAAAGSAGLTGADRALAEERRRTLAAQQTVVRRAIEQRGVRVLTGMDTAVNALVVEAGRGEVERIGRLAGVARVIPDRAVHGKLDRALVLDGVAEAITRIGADRAGAGIRVGILDSGIDASHAGFQDDALAAPEGFPRVSSDANSGFVTRKIIVARSYETLAADAAGYGVDVRDVNGHGTSVACSAACASHVSPLGRISGSAPKAFLGVYKVLGNNGSGATSLQLKAIDDAMKDGMDVLNLSLGNELSGDPQDDIGAKALNAAADAGLIVVCAAGNEGPDDNSINSPGFAEKAISVGSSASDRLLDIEGNTGPNDPNAISPFSSRGPSPSANLKPDMVAVGDNFYTAASTFKNPDASYTVTQGTSFATPTVAGAAAVLKAARPSLTAAQYRSLLVNSATGLNGADSAPLSVRAQGAGRMNLAASLEQPLAVEPVSVHFGRGGPAPSLKRELTLTNLTASPLAVTVAVQSFDKRSLPVISAAPSGPIPPQGSAVVTMQFGGAELSGEYQGVILVANDANAVVARVPYWYAVRSSAVAGFSVFKLPESAAAGETALFYVRMVDSGGVDLLDDSLTVTPLAGGGSVVGAEVFPDAINMVAVGVKMGAGGDNVFRLKSGSASRDVTIALRR